MERAPVEPETNQPVSPEPVPEEKVSLSLTDLKALISGAVQEAVAPFAKANLELQEKIAQAGRLEYAENIPGHLQRRDPNFAPSRSDVARSVTIATRPVIENPEQYSNVVDPGGLSINNASPLSPKAMAECFEEPNGTS